MNWDSILVCLVSLVRITHSQYECKFNERICFQNEQESDVFYYRPCENNLPTEQVFCCKNGRLCKVNGTACVDKNDDKSSREKNKYEQYLDYVKNFKQPRPPFYDIFFNKKFQTISVYPQETTTLSLETSSFNLTKTTSTPVEKTTTPKESPTSMQDLKANEMDILFKGTTVKEVMEDGTLILNDSSSPSKKIPISLPMPDFSALLKHGQDQKELYSPNPVAVSKDGSLILKENLTTTRVSMSVKKIPLPFDFSRLLKSGQYQEELYSEKPVVKDNEVEVTETSDSTVKVPKISNFLDFSTSLTYGPYQRATDLPYSTKINTTAIPEESFTQMILFKEKDSSQIEKEVDNAIIIFPDLYKRKDIRSTPPGILGRQPTALVNSPNGKKFQKTNSSQDKISKMETTTSIPFRIFFIPNMNTSNRETTKTKNNSEDDSGIYQIQATSSILEASLNRSTDKPQNLPKQIALLEDLKQKVDNDVSNLEENTSLSSNSIPEASLGRSTDEFQNLTKQNVLQEDFDKKICNGALNLKEINSMFSNTISEASSGSSTRELQNPKQTVLQEDFNQKIDNETSILQDITSLSPTSNYEVFTPMKGSLEQFLQSNTSKAADKNVTNSGSQNNASLEDLMDDSSLSAFLKEISSSPIVSAESIELNYDLFGSNSSEELPGPLFDYDIEQGEFRNNFSVGSVNSTKSKENNTTRKEINSLWVIKNSTALDDYGEDVSPVEDTFGGEETLIIPEKSTHIYDIIDLFGSRKYTGTFFDHGNETEKSSLNQTIHTEALFAKTEYTTGKIERKITTDVYFEETTKLTAKESTGNSVHNISSRNDFIQPLDDDLDLPCSDPNINTTGSPTRTSKEDLTTIFVPFEDTFTKNIYRNDVSSTNLDITVAKLEKITDYPGFIIINKYKNSLSSQSPGPDLDPSPDQESTITSGPTKSYSTSPERGSSFSWTPLSSSTASFELVPGNDDSTTVFSQSGFDTSLSPKSPAPQEEKNATQGTFSPVLTPSPRKRLVEVRFGGRRRWPMFSGSTPTNIKGINMPQKGGDLILITPNSTRSIEVPLFSTNEDLSTDMLIRNHSATNLSDRSKTEKTLNFLEKFVNSTLISNAILKERPSESSAELDEIPLRIYTNNGTNSGVQQSFDLESLKSFSTDSEEDSMILGMELKNDSTPLNISSTSNASLISQNFLDDFRTVAPPNSKTLPSSSEIDPQGIQKNSENLVSSRESKFDFIKQNFLDLHLNLLPLSSFTAEKQEDFKKSKKEEIRTQDSNYETDRIRQDQDFIDIHGNTNPKQNSINDYGFRSKKASTLGVLSSLNMQNIEDVHSELPLNSIPVDVSRYGTPTLNVLRNLTKSTISESSSKSAKMETISSLEIQNGSALNQFLFTSSYKGSSTAQNSSSSQNMVPTITDENVRVLVDNSSFITTSRKNSSVKLSTTKPPVSSVSTKISSWEKTAASISRDLSKSSVVETTNLTSIETTSPGTASTQIYLSPNDYLQLQQQYNKAHKTMPAYYVVK